MKIKLKLLFFAGVLCMSGFPVLAKSATIVQQQGTPSMTVRGEITDQETQEPIAYASIGILDNSVGTISNETGAFSLTLPAGQEHKVVRISAIGYEAKDIQVKELLSAASKKSVSVSLLPKPVQLAEVKVSSKNWKSVELGGKLGPGSKFSHSFIITSRPIQANLGREIGIHINNGQKLSYLSKLNFCLKSNKYNLVKFRLNVYEVKNGKPGQNLLPKDIYVTVKDQKTGWMQVDLEPYDIYLEQDFVVSLEWIDCAPKQHSLGLSIPASLPGFQTAFHKDASQSKWQKIPAAGMGMNVVVQREN